MGLFETQPWLLVPIIIVTVEGWFAIKAAIRDRVRQRKERAAPGGWRQ